MSQVRFTGGDCDERAPERCDFLLPRDAATREWRWDDFSGDGSVSTCVWDAQEGKRDWTAGPSRDDRLRRVERQEGKETKCWVCWLTFIKKSHRGSSSSPLYLIHILHTPIRCTLDSPSVSVIEMQRVWSTYLESGSSSGHPHGDQSVRV